MERSLQQEQVELEAEEQKELEAAVNEARAKAEQEDADARAVVDKIRADYAACTGVLASKHAEQRAKVRARVERVKKERAEKKAREAEEAQKLKVALGYGKQFKYMNDAATHRANRIARI